ncbi:MAG: hypothetical protein GF355_11085 [Candidatus Eisenbacteria bacterium]|nr:hypothetical protein [Candidatus Eisenbacteria bacterium]
MQPEAAKGAPAGTATVLSQPGGPRPIPTPGLRDRLLAALGLAALGPPVAAVLVLRQLVGPGDVILSREVRIGRERRMRDRRRDPGWAPIDRRQKDRRRTNQGGCPYSAFRIRLRSSHRARRLRRADAWLRRTRAASLPGLLNVLRGHATLLDLYPGDFYDGRSDGGAGEEELPLSQDRTPRSFGFTESQRRRVT